MRLDLLLGPDEVLEIDGDPGVDITEVAYASGDVGVGSLFCCLPGRHRDGHDFAPEAVARGARALVVERPLGGLSRTVTQVRVGDARHAMAAAAAALHGHPSRRLRVVGITGTNGKSTTAHLVRTILDRAGLPCGLVGTMTSARTTPESPDLQRALAGFAEAGKAAVALEVSSVGLAQRRVDAIRFSVAVFTNLSPDEQWIHGSMEAYFRAKAMLFEPDRAELAVVAVDDEWGLRLAREIEDRGSPGLRRFGLADAEGLVLGVGSSSFRFRGHPVELALDGAYNVANALAALTVAVELGVDPAVAAAALGEVDPLPGHAEAIEAGQPFRVVVDFAHTPAALASVLRESRRAAAPGGRVVVVFGCGGDRDPGRRPSMGAAAAEAADVVYVTSDNPRSEDPMSIISSIVEGARTAGAADLRVVADRRAAISEAVALARSGDVVVLAGKGHENGQIVGTEVFAFDDAAEARRALAAAGYGRVSP